MMVGAIVPKTKYRNYLSNIIFNNCTFHSIEFEELAGQEWLIFQKKLHLLDDFVSKWNGLLEPYTTVTLFIKQDLENYFVRCLIAFSQVYVSINTLYLMILLIYRNSQQR